MALSPFSLNPSTSSSSICKFTESQPLYLLLLQSQTHSSITFRHLNFRVSCSQRVVQVETRRQPERVKVPFETTKQRKKRKPRPSFFEQIRDKWTAKLGSQREKFPWQEESIWQEHQEQEEAKENEEEGESHMSLNDSESFGRQSSVISAPWAHGTKSFKPQVESKPKTPANVNRNENSPSGVISSPWARGTKPFKPQVEFESKTPGNIDGNGIDELKGSEITKPSSRIQREFKSQNDGISKEERKRSTYVNGFSLDETPSRNRDNVSLVGSGYDSGASELELREGENVRRKRSNTPMAEKMLPEHELKRLRNVSLRMLERIKVGAAGITQALVDTIHDKWKLDEAVKLKFEEPYSVNMRRTHEILETKSGGLVIWRSGSSVVLYRGMNYNLPCVQSYAKQNLTDTTLLPDLESVTGGAIHNILVEDLVRTTRSPPLISAEHVKGLPEEDIMHLNDLNRLLDELGPRFTDWLGREPLPVDADLLSAVVPNYRSPFRLLPYRVKPGLRNREMTVFRRIARTIPPHFALGRNRELQGLAKAMVKLWEKSAIAKIAIKRGVQNTNNERMAEELKRLTGGTLLSRNKDFIVFYRGNDFLPPVVTEALKERRKLRDLQQDEEEQARQIAPAFTESKTKASTDQLVAGTLAETMAATARWGNRPSNADIKEMIKDSTLARRASILRHLEKKLALAKGKLKLADKALAKVQEHLDPAELPNDLETLTDEERFLFRKMGLSMKPFLVLGRRGVYDGTVENMHLHWKYRELVKIIVRGKSFEQVKHIAISLEAESNGVLALARSIELQRREALRHRISDLKERIELLKCELEDTRNEEMIDAEGSLQSTMADSLLSVDDTTEDDRDEAYLETYDSSNEDGDNCNEHKELRQVE
ncbi:RNA-binding, CRM domain containing protein [Parasponia andersonii]|uniref:RNA-binding, CRM domain containing protein n=1 Tax=Parasponia andersonii TaxID=3476 RepID=A0A2P5BDC9_PARAD|nr:RNA-binding, CRM domain containing protein [Parasponia andersonii]